jgi:hypothetical protein
MRKLSLSAALPIVIALPFVQLACETAKEPETKTDTETETEVPQGFGHCAYVNKFSQAEECREYEGTTWTLALVTEDCDGQNGQRAEGPCSYEKTLGTCVLGEGEQKTLVIAPGDDPGKCSGQKLGCETFGGGTWLPDEACQGEVVDPDPISGSVFLPPELTCKDPVAGEAPGSSADGKVCTWSAVGGCTEPGRKFADYSSCSDIYTQRPYYPVPAPPDAEAPDARMDDPAYVAELNWVTEQVEACACVCCHQDSITPKGAGVWDIETKGNWMSSFTPYGLAFAGGFIPSWPLGAYPKEDNNGFDRSVTGLPTTDIARMQAFFAGELEHRGMSPADFANEPPTPDIFYDQHTYKPGACESGVGVAPDGSMTWTDGGARYLYVLEEGSDNPGVPPNLDLPDGTVWKLDVRPDSSPVKSGQVTFGKVPAGAAQAFPEDGSTPVLTPGKTYYLYALMDVGIPITRCVFNYTGQ